MPSKTTSVTLRPHQHELKHLSELAGIYLDNEVFGYIVELMNMGIDADVIYNLLKTLRKSRTRKSKSSLLHQASTKTRT